MFEAKHVGLDDPSAGRHSVEPEDTIIVRKRHQALFALGRPHGRSGNRLAAGLNRSRLCKNQWQAHCQKHENLEH